MLLPFQSYKIDLSSKQLTVDFVNQDVLKPSEDSETPLPAEINEFSERLGTLNSRWEVVSRHVSDRLASLEGVHGKWEEFEKSLARLIAWFREQEDKIKKYHLIGHEVSVRQTLKDCKVGGFHSHEGLSKGVQFNSILPLSFSTVEYHCVLPDRIFIGSRCHCMSIISQ